MTWIKVCSVIPYAKTKQKHNKIWKQTKLKQIEFVKKKEIDKEIWMVICISWFSLLKCKSGKWEVEPFFVFSYEISLEVKKIFFSIETCILHNLM